jgi:isoleucyl-tRNA synthetase
MTEHPRFPEPSAAGVPEREEEILRFWKDHDVFRKSVERPASKNFVFYEGPPTANALPGIHHAAGRIVKDLVCRFRTMQGFRVVRKGGWDTHGLPVEIEVEKELGFKEKGEIEAYGIGRFNRKCRERVFRFSEEWERMSDRIGFWVDMQSPYVTCENDYIESVWSILKRFWDSGLIYRGHKVVPYCPRCGTPLSSHEVSQGYADVVDPSITVRMRVQGEKGKSFLVWTTTPWTLPSNAAIAVAPRETYAEVEAGDETLILAEARLPHVFRESPRIVRRIPGSELVGMRYERLFPYAAPDEKAWRVIAGDFVSLEEGTGIVHIAPAYGEDDYRVGREEGLPVISLVDEAGRFVPEVTDWAGRPVKEADPEIIRNLEGRGLLFHKGRITHSYPHCWRCSTPLLYIARESWFIRTTAIRDRLVEENAKIDWYPPETGQNRFGRWLESNVDWCISRDRYWGTPLNIWRCESCGEFSCVGSVGDLRAEALGPLPEPIDLHRPWVDGLRLRCACGGERIRVPEVIDVWFDSGCMPYAQYHYPFDDGKRFEDQFPADFICEGTDQTRGWFHSLLAISTHVSGRSSYKSCFGIGLVLDEEGKKMSKSKGNVVDPWVILSKYGADSLRWCLVWGQPLWQPRRFSVDTVREVGYPFVDTLRNTLSFFLLYASLDGWRPGARPSEAAARGDMDRWILSRLHSTARGAGEALDRYDLTRAGRALQELVIDDLSNWYVRRNRKRFWKSEADADKNAAFSTLYEVLTTLAKLLAPIVPFVSEEIHRTLAVPFSIAEPESVHLAAYPVPDPSRIDAELEEAVSLSREVVNLGRAVRMRVSIKTRQPVRKIVVALPEGGEAASRLERVRDTVRDELNARALEIVPDGNALIRLSAKPVFPKIGPEFGPRAGKAAAAIKGLTPEIVRRIVGEGSASVEAGGESFVLKAEHIEVREDAAPPFAMERGARAIVFVDTELDEDLLAEGFAREMVNKIQFMRKASGFEVADRIRVVYAGSERLARAVERHAGQIRSDTLAVSMERGEPEGERIEEWDLNGEPARIAVARVRSAGGSRAEAKG